MLAAVGGPLLGVAYLNVAWVGVVNRAGQVMTERPGYDAFADMSESRGPLADAFASQVLATTTPWLNQPANELDVLDLGSGYGGTSVALSRQCRSVLGLEPARFLYEKAGRVASRSAARGRHIQERRRR